MIRKFKKASLISAAVTITTMLIAAASSGAAAESQAQGSQTPAASAELSPAIPGFTSGDLETRPLPTELSGDAPAPVEEPLAPAQITAASLQALVAAQPVGDEVSSELKCLATAIYFESRSESLPGQLAVGRVIVNRSRSGRFPNSYCGVVNQPSQFSYAHDSRVSLNPRLWRNAIAVAQIAHDGSWQSEAEGALFFHAARVSPAWRLQKVARIDNHIFYR